jgi:hypothetical protein
VINQSARLIERHGSTWRLPKSSLDLVPDSLPAIRLEIPHRTGDVGMAHPFLQGPHINSCRGWEGNAPVGFSNRFRLNLASPKEKPVVALRHSQLLSEADRHTKTSDLLFILTEAGCLKVTPLERRSGSGFYALSTSGEKPPDIYNLRRWNEVVLVLMTLLPFREALRVLSLPKKEEG